MKLVEEGTLGWSKLTRYQIYLDETNNLFEVYIKGRLIGVFKEVKYALEVVSNENDLAICEYNTKSVQAKYLRLLQAHAI